jgi:hypothetical protein
MIVSEVMMPTVRVLRSHVFNGVVRRVGELYDVSDGQASERARVGLVELVSGPDSPPLGVVAKAEYAMYAPRHFRFPESEILEEVVVPHVIRRSSNWWIFSDDTKVLGQSAAAAKLGVSVEEFVRDHADYFS